MLSQDPHKSVLLLTDWQSNLLVGFGYGSFIMGVLYVALGLYPTLIQARRDKLASSIAQAESMNQRRGG